MGTPVPAGKELRRTSQHGRHARGRLNFGGILLLLEFTLAAISLPSSPFRCIAQSLASDRFSLHDRGKLGNVSLSSTAWERFPDLHGRLEIVSH